MLRQVAWVAFTLIGVVAIGNVAAQFRYGESWVSVFLWPELSRHRVTNSGAMRVPGRIAVIYSNDQPACFSNPEKGFTTEWHTHPLDLVRQQFQIALGAIHETFEMRYMIRATGLMWINSEYIYVKCRRFTAIFYLDSIIKSV